MLELIKGLLIIIAIPFIFIYYLMEDLVRGIHSKMQLHNKVEFVSSNLTELPQRVQTCRELALTLIETDQKLTQSETVWKVIAPTEYDRARKQVISTCHSTLSELVAIRRKSLSADAIKIAPMIKNLVNCCERCLSENQESMSLGQPFCCLLEMAQMNNSTMAFRFTLNEKGQIIEQS